MRFVTDVVFKPILYKSVGEFGLLMVNFGNTHTNAGGRLMVDYFTGAGGGSGGFPCF